MAAKYTGYVYQGEDKDWYWKILAKNGNKVANGGEGYKNRGTAAKMLKNVTLCGVDVDNFTLILDLTEAEQAKADKKLK